MKDHSFLTMFFGFVGGFICIGIFVIPVYLFHLQWGDPVFGFAFVVLALCFLFRIPDVIGYALYHLYCLKVSHVKPQEDTFLDHYYT